MNHRLAGAAGAATISLVLVLTGCAGVRTERQGKQVGKSICDLKDADDADEAKREIEKINEDFSDAVRITGVDVNQDVRAIDENLDDLAEHAAQDNDALQEQDLAVIRRNLSQAIDSTSDNVQRYYQGVREGLDTCYDN
jgi:hypothetical protein